MISFTIPIRLVCATNSREHWSVVAKRAKQQRGFGAMFTQRGMADLKSPLPKTVQVRITRIGKRKTDGDNLSTGAKYIRDGIADALGINDGDEKRVTWCYAQEIGKEYGCRVEIDV